MQFEHKPVLLEECIENLHIKPDGTYIDGTIGGAGHSLEIYKRLNEEGLLIGIDQDSYAIEVSRKRLEEASDKAKFKLVNRNFSHIKEICFENNINEVDGILLDLGVSSHQLDEAERGFSYQKDAPLDMRMDRSQIIDAETIVNEYSEENIKEIIRNNGEERWAARIASFIIKARSIARIKTTAELVDIIKAAVPKAARRDGPHPAKRTFQALRIAVNDELGILGQAVKDAVSVLGAGGTLCVITFHSLEDRIVKNEFQRMINPCTCPREFPICVCGAKQIAEQVSRKPILPSKEEIEVNPRSRSAKLRVIRKV